MLIEGRFLTMAQLEGSDECEAASKVSVLWVWTAVVFVFSASSVALTVCSPVFVDVEERQTGITVAIATVRSSTIFFVIGSISVSAF